MENFFRFCGFLSDEEVVEVLVVLVPEEAVAVDLTKWKRLGFETLRRNLDERDMAVAAASASSFLSLICLSFCVRLSSALVLSLFLEPLDSAGCSAGERENTV